MVGLFVLFFLWIRQRRRSTRLTHSCPTRRSSGLGGAADAWQQIERPAENRRIGTEPQRLRHRHAGGESRLDQRELLCAAMADGDTGRRIGAQDQLAPAEMRSAGNRQIERVIFLYGSAADRKSTRLNSSH